MSERHEHKHNHSDSYKNIGIAFFLNLIFSIAEALGGLFTNSISIISDAIHDFGDAISLGISFLLEKKSQKKPNDTYTYGYLRYSLLGAIITSIILLIGSILVLYNAIPRLFNPVAVDYDVMIVFAIFGFLINSYAAYRTSHAEKHNEKAINLHMLEDVFGWIAVLIGSICIKLFNLYIIDPILSIIIALYILFHVYKYLKEIFEIFMEKVPSDIGVNDVRNTLLKKFNEVEDIHHIHIWTLDGINNYITAHILLKDKMKNENIILLKKKLKEELNLLNINHSTLEIEYNNEKCEHKKCKND